jgi:peroxiredoxin
MELWRPDERPRNRLLFLTAIVVLLVAAFAIYAGVSGLFEPSTRPSEDPVSIASAAEEGQVSSPPTALPATGTALGLRAPDFRLTSLDGDSVALSDFSGHVVIIDFWASWCTPCRTSMPALHTLWQKYRDRGVVLLGVSLDRTEASASAFIEANGYQDMVAVWDAHQAVAALYGVSGIPHTLVVDAEGIIRFADHPARLTASAIEAAL